MHVHHQEIKNYYNNFLRLNFFYRIAFSDVTKFLFYIKTSYFLRPEKQVHNEKFCWQHFKSRKWQYQMSFFGNIDIYDVKNRLNRYLWMLEFNNFKYYDFSQILKKYEFESFLPTFSSFEQKELLFTFFKTLISL